MHARSVVACGLDDDTGEVFRVRLAPDPDVVFSWLRQLPDPVAVVTPNKPTFMSASVLRR